MAAATGTAPLWSPFMPMPSASTPVAPHDPQPKPKIRIKIRPGIAPASVRSLASAQANSYPFTTGQGPQASSAPSPSFNPSYNFCPSKKTKNPPKGKGKRKGKGKASNTDSGYASGSTNSNSNGPATNSGMATISAPFASSSSAQPQAGPSSSQGSPVEDFSSSFNFETDLPPYIYPSNPTFWSQLPTLEPDTKILSDPFAADRARGTRFIKVDKDIDPLAPNSSVKYRVRMPAGEVDKVMQEWLDWRADRRITRCTTSFEFFGSKTQAGKNKVKKRTKVKPFYKR